MELNYTLINSFIESIFDDMEITSNTNVGENYYMITKDKNIISIIKDEYDGDNYFKFIIDGKNFITLNEKEFEILKPFKGLKITNIINRLSKMNNKFEKYFYDDNICDEIIDFFYVILEYYQEIFYSDVMKNITKNEIKKTKKYTIKNHYVFDKQEEIILYRNQNELMIISNSLN